MKKFLVSATLLMSTVALVAQTIAFQATKHDFGTIKQEDGDATAYFEFTNTGNAPLLISNVRTSCGCTRPTWPSEPIEPGQKGTISATYRASTRPNYFQKTITVYSNDPEHATVMLTITGNVTPKPTNPGDQYSVTMGDLKIKSKKMSFGEFVQIGEVERTIEYGNFTDHDIAIDVIINDDDKFLSAQLTNNTLKPQESGKIIFTIDTKKCKIGPNTAKVYVMVNNQVVRTDEYAIDLSINVNENFTTLSEQDKRQAPIAEIPTVLNMGTIAKGKVAKKALSISNVGINPLSVRRVYTSAEEMSVSTSRGIASVKSGKKADVQVTVNPFVKNKELAAGQYSRSLIIYTNDPSKPKRVISVTWTIE